MVETTFRGGASYGEDGWKSGFSNGARVVTHAESNTANITIVGHISTIAHPSTGDDVASGFLQYLPTAPTGYRWVVLNSTLSGEECSMATMSIECVLANAYNVYEESWTIDLQEVQMSITQHPSVLSEVGTPEKVNLWQQTPESERMYTATGDTTGDSRRFRYRPRDVDGTTQPLSSIGETTYAHKCILAMSSGIETFNVYLPVVTKTSRYIKIFGSDGSTMPYSGNIGKHDVPDKRPSGYSANLIHWFKNTDRYERSANGMWTRTEQWTYTDSTKHSWIYGDIED